MKTINIRAGSLSLPAELNESQTAQKIWAALPIEGSANRWGDEIYFDIPVSSSEEPGAHQDMQVGDLAYWPVGSAFCIFFGPTPVSRGDQPRAYSPVNVVGRVAGDARLFRQVKDGERVFLEKTE